MPPHPLAWRTLSSEVTFQDRWLTVRSDECLTPGGARIGPYHVIGYPDWVNVVAVRPDGKLVLALEYRHGAAWMQLALQAMEMGLQTHAMAGFDRDRAAALLGVPETCRLEAAIAIGWPGDPAALPEALQARETPSGRHPIESFSYAGRFPPAAPA